MRKLLLILMFLTSIFGTISCNCKPLNEIPKGILLNGDTIPYRHLGELRENVLKIRGNVDLQGGTCILPEGVTLDLRKGRVENGCLVGCNTKLLCKDSSLNKIHIEGIWNVPIIRSSYFVDLSYENALLDVVALSNSTIHNKILISCGDYYINIKRNGGSGIVINSSTDVTMRGHIHLIPNEHRISYIVLVKGKNITIKGDGVITGDKGTHLGTSGEWGMGMCLDKAENVSISNLTIKDCWGDCLYVGGESKNIRIENCKLDNGRRQGISITSCEGAIIRNCRITNVNGTAPQYAIDVEPNAGEICDNIIIENVKVNNCRGGIQIFGRAKNARIGKVEIHRSYLREMQFVPIRAEKCDSLVLDEVKLSHYNTSDYKRAEDIGDFTERKTILAK